MIQPINIDRKDSTLVKKRTMYGRCYKQLTMQSVFSFVNQITYFLKKCHPMFNLLHVRFIAIKAIFDNESVLGLSGCKCMCSHELAKVLSSSGE